VLDWAAESDHPPVPVADAVPATVVPRPAPAPGDSASPLAVSEAAVAQATPMVRDAAAHPPAVDPQAAPAARDVALVFTLEVHLAGDVWVAFQQEDAQAPALGRHGGVLAAALLALYGAGPERPRRFYCPLAAGQPTTAEDASQALAAF